MLDFFEKNKFFDMLSQKMPEILLIKVKIIIEVIEVAMKYVNLKFLKLFLENYFSFFQLKIYILSLLQMKKLNIEEEKSKRQKKRRSKK